MGATSQETAGGAYAVEFGRETKAKATAAAGEQLTILVVEDNEDTRDMLRLWLETDGYRVSTAGSGWEGVQLALNGSYDAILMDMSLPVMDGITAVHLLHEHERLRDVPVVAITAYDLAYPRAEALAATCSAYMVKPINFHRLEKVLSRLLGH